MANFSVAAAPVAVKATVTKLPQTNTLHSYSLAPQLLLKEVSSWNEAIGCGGVILIRADGWQMVAGDVMREAIKRRGIPGLFDYEQYRLKQSWRLLDNRWFVMQGAPYGIKYCSVDVMQDFNPNIVNQRWPDDAGVLVLGVVTKGHGSGFGPRLAAGADYVVTDVSGNPDIRFTDLNARPVSGYEPPFAEHAFALSTRLTLSESAAQYYLSRKGMIIEKWRALGAVENEVLAVYEDTYEAAVEATFATDRRLDLMLSFVGAGDDLFSVTDIWRTRSSTQAFLYFGPGDNPIEAVPAKAIAETGRWMYGNLCYDAKAARGGIVTGAGLTNINATHGKWKLGDAMIDTREILGAALPRSAIDYSTVAGTLDLETIAAKYTSLTDRAPNWSASATGTDAQKVASANADFTSLNQQARLGPGSFLGGYLETALRLGDNWDTLAKEAVES